MFRQKNGFTLIEVMMVVAIIGIMAAMAIPQYAQYAMNSKRTEAFIWAKDWFVAQTSIYAESDICFHDNNPVLSSQKIFGDSLTTTPKWNYDFIFFQFGSGSPLDCQFYLSANLDSDVSRDVVKIQMLENHLFSGPAGIPMIDQNDYFIN